MLVVIMTLPDLSCHREAMVIIGVDRTIKLPTEILWFMAVHIQRGKPRAERYDGKRLLMAKVLTCGELFDETDCMEAI